jgi:hypothetical protein
MGQIFFRRWSKYPNVECNSGSQPSVHCVLTDIIKKQFSHSNENKAFFSKMYTFTFVF